MMDVPVIILSGACCNAAFASIDRRVETRLRQAAEEMGLNLVLKTITLTSAALGGLGLGKQLGEQVHALLQSTGLGALPIIFINGKLAFHSGVPDLPSIRKALEEYRLDV
ncbi:MAG: hypothetical protein ACM3NT_07155 [Methylocystaceae bacterium]